VKNFQTEVRLAREMTTIDATLIGVGAMIGAGIFVLIGIAAGVAGPALIIAFILNGIIALLTAMSYAELGSCYHDAGGGYLWVKEGLPKWNGFLSGWMSWFAHAVACSLYALGFGAYFEHVLSELAISIPHWGFISPQKILAALTALLFAYVNFRGASETGKIGNLVTLTKIIILLIFIGFGLEIILRKGDLFTTFSPFVPNGTGGIFKAMGLTFIAFQGFEVIAQSSEEIKNPKKNIPKAVFLSLLIVIPIYLLVAVVSMGTVRSGNLTPWQYLAEQKEIALVEVARNFFVGGGVLILIGGLISTISALNATIYSSSRVAYAMGRDRNFPAFFSKVHSRNLTPNRSIWISLIIIVLMAVSFPVEDVASAADIMFLLLFLQVNLAMIKLRKKRPDLERGFKVPFFPYLTILGILMLLFLTVYMFNYSMTAWMVTIVWITLGLLVYRFYASTREIEHAKKLDSLKRISEKDYKILACLSKTDNIGSMADVASALAKKHKAEIIFLHVVELPEKTKLHADSSETEAVGSILEKAQQYSEGAGIPSRSIIRISHRISNGIVDTAVEEGCNFILIGRNKKSSFTARIFASSLDKVLQKAPCEVAILFGDINAESIRHILIPFSFDIHTLLAVEVAPALTEYYKADLAAGIVMNPGISPEGKKDLIRRIRNVFDENVVPVKINAVYDEDILHGIELLAVNADLLVMGGKSGDFLEQMFAKSLSREITGRVDCPVLWIKEFEERVSFFQSIFRSVKN
jgi:basic amino acid/polyamine antiporter, APA family